MNRPVRISIETPNQEDVVALLQTLDAYLSDLYAAEHNHILGVEALLAPEVTFFVARHDGKALGCGALLRHPDGYGEVKRLFVLPAARGQGIAKRILCEIEAQARENGLDCLRLETGVHQPEALGLYRKSGYTEIGPFGAYESDPLSVFMQKTLDISTSV